MAESTKVHIVYDASADNKQGVPSLNECLDIGPPLQKMIHDILLRIRVSTIVLAGDIRQAFLQIIIRETERDTVYDASAENKQGVPSLNECLDIGPPLQKMIHDILLRIRVSTIVLAGDIRQAFLQIIIRETERDTLRFIWIHNLDDKNPVILRGTRALFGLVHFS